jgi:anti-sigma regulatory factor (Ser/Thr protein kinase)
MSAAALPQSQPQAAFRHEALLYAGEADFLAGTLPFIRGGLADDGAILVVVAAAKIDLLRDALGDDAGAVGFADMAKVGTNPALIIPAWQEFVAAQAASSRRFRGIGEPIWPERRGAVLVECQRHESLLNIAFDDGPAWRLLCPYDTAALEPAVVDEVARTHPFMTRGAGEWDSDEYVGGDAARLDAPLPEPPAGAVELAFSSASLAVLRGLTSREAARAGLRASRIGALVLAVNEVATNSVGHGGGQGRLRIWQDADTLVCEIRDRGHIEQPLVDRQRPGPGAEGGGGLWLANHLCDLVQVRSSASGAVVRLHERRR